MNSRFRAAGLALLAFALVGTIVWLSRTTDVLVILLERVQSVGPWGPLLFIVIYIVGCVIFLPGSLLSIGAGFLFGLPVGIVTVSLGSTLGAGAAFLIGRTVLRKWVTARFATMPRFRALDEAVGKQGFKIVLLTRLSPVFPFNLLNYAFAATSVSLRDYMAASWLGMLPGAVLYVYIGTAMNSLVELASGRTSYTWGEGVLFSFGLVATVAVLILLFRIARNALARALPESREIARPATDRTTPNSAGDDHGQ